MKLIFEMRFLLLILLTFALSACFSEKKNSYEKYLTCISESTNVDDKIHQKYCFDKYGSTINGNHLVMGNGSGTFETWRNKNEYTVRSTGAQIVAVKNIQIWLREKDTEDGLFLSYILQCEHKMLPTEETKIGCFHDTIPEEEKKEFNEVYQALEKSKKREGGWAINDVTFLSTN